MTRLDWYKDAVIYELRVRSFYDSNADGIGDLRGVVQKLDYLKDLGVSALWLLPTYPSPLKDDGYDIADYFSVHPSVGTLDDFRELLNEAHARGLKVITELVLNHTSDQHPWFERSRLAAPGSPERDYYVWSDTPDKWSEARVIFQDYETSNWTWDPVAKAYFWHRFFSHQPDLNFDSPDVRASLLEVVDFWFALGVDGMRLDAVPYLYERPGTTCENLPETHEYLRTLRAHVEQRFPDRMLLAEANQWPEDAARYFGAGDECHMSFHFPLMPRLFMALRMEDSYPISDILEQTPAIPETCQWAIFLRNHDELTLEMVTDEERDYMVERYAADRQTRINLGIRRRLAPLLENDRRSIELMNLLLLSLPGTPVLYYGDEIGMGDNAYLGDRDGVRTPMQWSPDRNGGFSRANPQRLILPTISDPEYRYESVNVELQEHNPSSLLWWTKRMIALRKQHSAFGRGSLRMLAPENRKVLAFLREHEGQALLVVANLSRHPQWVELELGEFAGRAPIELLGNGAFPLIESRPYRLTLGGHDALWFSLSSELQRQRHVSLAPPAPANPVEYVGSHVHPWQLGRELSGVLKSYLPAQRWFRSKTLTAERATLLDILHLGTPPGSAGAMESGPWLAVVRLELAGGQTDDYVLPLNLVRSAERPASALLALRDLHEAEAHHFLCDASFSPDVARALHDIAFGERSLVGKRLQLNGKRSAAGRVDAPEPIRPLGTEQSNTSFVFGQRLVGKLLRRLEAGPSLEVEVLHALSSASARCNAPTLEARIGFEQGSERGTLWVSEGFIANEGDAWHLTIDHAQRFYESVLSKRRGEEPRPGGLFEVADPTVAPDFVVLARLLGRRTAELHAALYETSRGETAPRRFNALSSRAFYQSVRNLSARVFDVLKTVSLAEPAATLARALVERKAAVRRVLDQALLQPFTAPRMRVHGDFHLGQVLYTGNDFYIIDFEGEPGRAPAERRRLRSPLADVAGMIRSFHYAAHGVLNMPLSGAQIRPEDRQQLEPWARAFYQASASAFLTQYLETAQSAPFLAIAPDELRTLLRIQLVEKALYELLYELDNRPTWAELPLRGLLSLLDDPNLAPSTAREPAR